MGRIYRRNATWYADYTDHGQRIQCSLRTTDRTVAKERLRDLELSATHSGGHKTEALADALDYFTNVSCAAKAKATRLCYEQKARHLTRLLGGVTLAQLEREHVERYIAARIKEGANPHTVHKELVTLRGTLKAAKGRTFRGTLDVIPAFKFKYEPRRRYLTPVQFLRLTEHLVQPVSPKAQAATRQASDELRARRILYCMLIAFASARRGELEAMRWEEHVDLASNRVVIPQGKTVSRQLLIAPQLRPWLEHFYERCGGVGAVVEPWGSVTRDLKDACARAKVPRVTCNDLRRTFASWLVQARESLFVVATLLGHSSTRMVEKVYGRLDAATLDSAIAKLPGGVMMPV